MIEGSKVAEQQAFPTGFAELCSLICPYLFNDFHKRHESDSVL